MAKKIKARKAVVSKNSRRNRNPRVVKGSMYFLIGLFLLFLISQLIQAIWNSKWNIKSQITMVIENNNQIYFVKIDKKFEEVLVYKFTDNVLIDVAGGYGEYKIVMLKKLADLEKKNFGEVLADSMTFYFGVITDGYINVNKEMDFNLKKSVLSGLVGRGKSNFSKWDLFNIYLYLENLRIEDVQILEVSELGFYEKENRVDGQTILKLNKNRFDIYVLSHIADSSFLEEKFWVEIFNTTSYPGLASMFGRVVTNSGLDLVGIRQSKNSFEKSFMLVDDGLIDNKSINIFAKHFGFKIIKKSEFDNNEESFGDRAGVVVVLGEDFVEKYF